MSLPIAANSTGAAVIVALAAGAAFAVGTVLQARAARQTPGGDAVRAGLLLDLAKRPTWRWGIGVAVASYGLQALALALGPIALVQPVVVSADLLFALPLAAGLAGRRLGRRELAGAACVAGGLSAFLAVASPSPGVNDPATSQWLYAMLSVYALVGVTLFSARRRSGAARTSLLAVSAGLCLGLMSALTKTFASLAQARGFGVFTQWQPWALAVVGFTALLLSQSAFQAGPLAIGLPLIDILEPVVAVAIAATLFQERLAFATLTMTLEAMGAALAVVGIFLLDRSALVLDAQASGGASSSSGQFHARTESDDACQACA